MRAILTSYGTTGDIFPLCVLASELRRHGHQPLLVVPRHCAGLVHQLGMQCRLYGPDVSAVQDEILKIQNRGESMQARYKELVGQLARSIPRAFSELSVLCRDADVLICSLDPPLGLTLHETLKIPYVALHLTCPYDDRWYRAEKRDGINRFRSLLGLGPLGDDEFLDPAGISPQLTIFALSRHVFPRRPDWPAHYHVAGFFFPDESGWEPDRQLASFMEDGDPPVAITFGSMMHEDTEEVSSIIIAAVERAGCRAVIQMGAPETLRHRLPPSMHPVGFASHSWLFARADSAVHHGSPGTAAAVFRAGIPALYVPHAFDQFEMARYAYEFGCAAPPIPITELNAEDLASALVDLRSNAHYRAPAAVLRNRIAEEDGIRTARVLIEDLIGGGQAKTARS